jgi:hypothetical protein
MSVEEKKTVNTDLPKLLRAIARGTNAQESRHNIIFNAAADHIDALTSQVKAGADEIEKMREALRPFANYHVTSIHGEREGWSIFIPRSSPQPKFADFDTARALSRPAPEAREKEGEGNAD